MNSPYFSKFRELMDKWDKAVEVLSENDLCLFFKKDGDIYGATENSRITFARMKNPETKEDKEWKKEATFVAYDLGKTEGDKKSTSIFNDKDVAELKVITIDQAEKELEKIGKKIPKIKEEDEENTFGEE